MKTQLAPRRLSPPKAAVVIVNYRTKELTAACVRSLGRLDWPNAEILVVDNQSRDGSLEYLRQNLPVAVIEAPSNGGYTAGNNLGITLALDRGAEYVHLLNPDTLVLRTDYLTRCIEYLEANPDVAVVGPKVHLRKEGRVQNTVLRFPWLARRAADWIYGRLGILRRRSGEKPVDAEVLNGVALVFRAAAIRDVGGLDERTFAYIEDVDWSYRASRRGWRRVYLPIDSVLHLQNEEGYERAGKVDFLLKRNTLYFLLKTRHVAQAVAYSVITVAMAGCLLAKCLLRQKQGEKWGLWLSRLLGAYWKLWTGRVDEVMGRPSW